MNETVNKAFTREGGLCMEPNRLPGKLITFCGLDGCGKTTMIRRLDAWLRERGDRVVLTKQPTDFVRKSAIFRTYMDCPEHDAYDYRSLSLLAASDRVQHSNRVIRPALKSGSIVISDRYFYSCLANLQARGYEQDRWIYEVAQSLPQPDLAVFLDIDVPEAIRRVRSRPEERNRFIDEALQYRLREQYIRIARENGGLLLSSAEPEEETFGHIRREMERVLRQAGGSERVS